MKLKYFVLLNGHSAVIAALATKSWLIFYWTTAHNEKEITQTQTKPSL